MLNRYNNYHSNQERGLQWREPQKRKKKQPKEKCLAELYQNAGCVFNYAGLGLYKDSRQGRMTAKQSERALRKGYL